MLTCTVHLRLSKNKDWDDDPLERPKIGCCVCCWLSVSDFEYEELKYRVCDTNIIMMNERSHLLMNFCRCNRLEIMMVMRGM